jgi:putative FmdB family regulatory protein
MPLFEYRCQSCGAIYDVFHKVREVVEDIVCPACQSRAYTKLISAPTVSTGMRDSASDSSCTTGSCCGGSCGIN